MSGRVLITRTEETKGDERNSVTSPGASARTGDYDANGNKIIKLKSLVAGDYFGERALLLREPRAATCTSEGGTRCLKLDREAFDEALSNVQVRAQGGGGRRLPWQHRTTGDVIHDRATVPSPAESGEQVNAPT